MKTIKELSEILRLNRNTIWRLIKKGKIKAVKVANKYRIPDEEVERIKREGTV